MYLEDKIIQKLNSSFSKTNNNLIGIGDDCAYLNKENLLISTDTFIEDVHFDLKKSNPKQVAVKFFNANYSDLQSSGGDPLYCFLNISFPKKKKLFIEIFLKNFTLLLKKYKIHLIGGDTTNSPNIISLTMTIVGKPHNKKIYLRSKAKEKESIFTFSNIGYSKLGYDILYKSKKINNEKINKKAINQFLNPKIHTYSHILEKLSVSSCMDLSDGLVNDLIKFSKKSRKKFILKNLNQINPTLFKYLNTNDYYNYVLSSGEEFVPIFTAPFSKIKIIKDLFKKNTKVNIVNIGSIIRGKGIIAEEYDLNKIKSFNHFD